VGWPSASLAHVEREAQQLGGAFDGFAVHDLGDAQVDLGEVVDADGRGDVFRRSVGVSRTAVGRPILQPSAAAPDSMALQRF